MTENPCGEIWLGKPGTGKPSTVNYVLNHYTWRRPAMVFGIVHDVLRNVWGRCAQMSTGDVVDREAVEITDVAVQRLAMAALHLSKIDLTCRAEVEKWQRRRGLTGVLDYIQRPALAMLRSAASAEFDAWQHHPKHLLYCDIRACKRALKVNPNAMPTTLGPLFSITPDDLLHLEMRWRICDAVDPGKKPLKGQRRAAFEAIWIAGEYRRAYEFAGAKTLPKCWEDTRA